MKKLLSVFLCLTVWLSVSAYDFEVDGIYYNIIGNGQVEVTCQTYNSQYPYDSYSSYSGAFTILSSVTYNSINYSVTSIGDAAFTNCSSLTSVTIPSGLTSIGNYAFYGCSGLTSVTIPNGLTSIGHHAFYGCSGLTSVTIPSSVTSMGNYAFYGCSGLTSVTIPSRVTSIGNYAFQSCSGLTSVTIQSGVTSIGDCAFEGCTGLTSVNIPNSVTSINPYAFRGCSGLTSVTIPSSVTSIGNYAFQGCSGLTSVTIQSGVTSIGNAAFWACDSLTSVTIPNSVTSIGIYAFYGCSGLTSVTIPKVAMPLDNSDYPPFYGCPLANVTIADGVDTICDEAFKGWSTINSVAIPQSVSSVGERIFEGCTGLTTITVDGNNAVIDSRDSCNAIIETATNQLIAGCVTTVIPRSVTSIGDYAFYDCIGLISLNIPNSVTSIGDNAFANCPNITDITCLATTPPTIESNTFANYDATLYVPSGSVSLYSANAYWKNFFIQPIPGVNYTITVASNDSLMGTTLGSGTYEENTNAQLVAVTQAGYSFQQWSDGNTDNPRNVVVTSDSTFTAEFTVARSVSDTIYLEYDGKDAMQYTLEDYGVYYLGGKVYNSQNLYIKLYYSDGKLILSGTDDIEMSSYPNGIYIVTDGKGGFLKINHYR